MSKHTPGPWVIRRPSKVNAKLGYRDFELWTEDHQTNIADVKPGVGTQEANARLISNAPEMLRVLKVVREYLNNEALRAFGTGEAVSLIGELIAKAEGESK